MADKTKTNREEADEATALKERIRELEAAEREYTRAEETSRKSDLLVHAISESAQDAILMMDVEGRISYWNPAAESLFGYTSDEALGRNLHYMLAPQRYHGQHNVALPEFQRSGRGNAVGKTLKLEALRKSGEEFPMELSLSSVRLHDGWHAVGIVRDISDREQASAALRESEERYRTLVENASDIIYRADNAGYFTFVNPAALRIMGYEEKEIIGKHYPTLIRPDKHEEAMEFFGRQFVKKIPNTYSEYPVILKDGREIWLGQNTQLIFQDGKVVAFQSVARDITEIKQAEEKIRQMAYHDSLTGLPNRKLFSDRLGIALAQAQRNQKGVAVTMLDLDHFKDVNDTLGHDVGDLLLKAAAERLSAELRKGDTVARFGGDEFVLILPDLKGVEDAIQVAEKIIDSFRKPFLIDTHQLLVTTSIGIAVYPHDGTDESNLLKNADIAMYQVKQTGRDRYQLYKKV